jgi:hypothetical protein
LRTNKNPKIFGFMQIFKNKKPDRTEPAQICRWQYILEQIRTTSVFVVDAGRRRASERKLEDVTLKKFSE